MSDALVPTSQGKRGGRGRQKRLNPFETPSKHLRNNTLAIPLQHAFPWLAGRNRLPITWLADGMRWLWAAWGWLSPLPLEFVGSAFCTLPSAFCLPQKLGHSWQDFRCVRNHPPRGESFHPQYSIHYLLWLRRSRPVSVRTIQDTFSVLRFPAHLRVSGGYAGRHGQ